MNEGTKMIWAAAFAKVFLEKRDYDLATLKAHDAVIAFQIAVDNIDTLKHGNRKDMLRMMSQ